MPSNIRRPDYTIASLQYIIENAPLEAYGMVMDLVPRIIDSINRAGDRVVQQNVAFVEALQNELQNMRSGLLTTHETIAAAMLDATVASYRTRLGASKWPQTGYRAGATGNVVGRYANDVLLDALGSKEVIRATYTGIGFPNTVFLDSRAKQWHRLNFGTGGGGGGAQYSSSFGGLVIGAIGMENESPSRPFRLPVGVWNDSQFYPASEGYTPRGGAGWRRISTPVSTKPVQAWNFLDAGVRTLARLLPVAYSTQISKMQEQAFVRSRGAFTRSSTDVLPLGPGGLRGRPRRTG